MGCRGGGRGGRSGHPEGGGRGSHPGEGARDHNAGSGAARDVGDQDGGGAAVSCAVGAGDGAAASATARPAGLSAADDSSGMPDDAVGARRRFHLCRKTFQGEAGENTTRKESVRRGMG